MQSRLANVFDSIFHNNTDAAEKLNVATPQAVSQYKHLKSQMSYEQLAYLAHSGININWLLTGEGEMTLSNSASAYEIVLDRLIYLLHEDNINNKNDKYIYFVEGALPRNTLIAAEPRATYRASAGDIHEHNKETK
jgi:hypothetical protein